MKARADADPLDRYRTLLDERRSIYAGLAHRPLHVTARLLRPVASIDPVLLDGPLRWGVGVSIGDREVVGDPRAAALDVPLPLAYRTGALSYPLASVAFLGSIPMPGEVVRAGNPKVPEYTVQWHKTWEHSGDDYLVFVGKSGKSTKGKVSIASAEFKGWSMPLTVLDVRELHWWCVGDAEEVARILACVGAVGKKGSYGFGAVRQWQVEEVDVDWSERGPEGMPTRPIPVELLAEPSHALRSFCAYRSPSYDIRAQRECWVPV